MKYYLSGEAVKQEKIDEMENAIIADPANIDNYPKAIRMYSGMLAVDPGNLMLYLNRGHRYLSIGAYEQAAADLTMGTLIDSNFWKNWHFLGMISYFIGNYEKALDYYGTALKLSGLQSSQTAAIINWESLCLRKLGRNDEAMQALNSFTPDTDNCVTPYHDLIRLNRKLISHSDIDEKWCGGVADKRMAGYQYGLAMNFYFKGDKVKAKELLEDLCARKEHVWFTFGYMAAMSELENMTCDS